MQDVLLFFYVCRLSERNCIEIVSKLIAEKQLEVVHTLDGKEYITPAQISREIRDELHVHGGKCVKNIISKFVYKLNYRERNFKGHLLWENKNT